jgi:hypothetical protein
MRLRLVFILWPMDHSISKCRLPPFPAALEAVYGKQAAKKLTGGPLN